MKIRKLQFLNRTIHVGMQAEASSDTHNISLFPGGYYLLEHKQSLRSYLVHASLAVAELEQDQGEQPEAPAKKGARVPA